jgi:N-acetyl-anhydromuramyl-L-alanine amidase AmpD
VKNGRPIERTPAHAKGHNKGSVGICLLGGHGGTRDDDFSENFTPEQKVALCDLIAKLKAEHKIRKIWGHNEVSSKACPCFDVKAWLKG